MPDPHSSPALRWRSLAAGLLVIAFAGGASAHDFWIEAADFQPPAGALVRLALQVGTRFPGDPIPHMTPWIVRFDLVGPRGTSPVTGVDGRVPAGLVRVGDAGGYAVVYRSTDTAVELPAAKFAEYLGEEGLEPISRQRAARGESGTPGRELFSRSVKALLDVAGGSAAGDRRVHTRVTGLPLELVPTVSPYALGAGGRLDVELLWQGKPLAGALVEADRREDPATVQRARSDRRGMVSFDVSAPGMWRLTTVHMQRAPAGVEADWQSVWTSLTFTRGPNGS